MMHLTGPEQLPIRYDSLELAQHVRLRTEESGQSCPAHLVCALRAKSERNTKHRLLIYAVSGHHFFPVLD